MFRAIILAAALAIAPAAMAQTTATPKQDRAAERKAMSDKRAECRRQAKEKKFGIHYVERKRFMDECMKRP